MTAGRNRHAKGDWMAWAAGVDSRLAGITEDEEPTYGQVAEWLPVDVREHIEATVPCPAGGAHEWEHGPAGVFHMMGRSDPVAVIEHWRCVGCQTVLNNNPEVYA